MAISGSALGGSTISGSAVNAADLVSAPAGYPAQERWPGAVSPSQYTDEGPEYPIEGPVAGSWVLDSTSGSVPAQLHGGGIQDTSWTTGTNGPETAWDSAAGAPFAPSKAVNPLLHAEDTGAVFQATHTVPAGIGKVTRHTGTGQTYSRAFAFDAVNGQYVPASNGRTNMDQAQSWDPNPVDGDAPFYPGYSERPIFNNVAYQSTPVTPEATPYSVAGALPDRSSFSYGAEAYEGVPDPVVTQPAPPAPVPSFSGGWVLG